MDINRKEKLKLRLKKYDYLFYTLLVPLYILAFFVEERLIVSDYHVVYLPVDDKIPFIVWFIYAYILWYPFLVCPGIFFSIKDKNEFRRYVTAICFSFFSVLVIYALIPNGQDLRPSLDGLSGISVDILRLIYAADTNTNVCPSMHVIGCIIVVFAVFKSEYVSKKARLPVIIGAVIISISTLFIKQHSILDLIIGIPYGIVCGLIAYPPKKVSRVSNDMADRLAEKYNKHFRKRAKAYPDLASPKSPDKFDKRVFSHMLSKFRVEAFSVPNILSYFRIILIPLFAVLYFNSKYYAAVGTLILSAATDVVDGKIARRLGQVTDLGKVLDPFADHMTQITMVMCVAAKNKAVLILLSLLLVKEAVMVTLGGIVVKIAGAVNSARWYGKYCTASLYATMMLFVLFPEMPRAVATTLIVYCAAVIILALTLYSMWYAGQIKLHRNSNKGKEDADTSEVISPELEAMSLPLSQTSSEPQENGSLLVDKDKHMKKSE
ncbi:MAG: CDP-alcohol phosphatidyltransferase family protein [Eubacteriales bacterium]|jgi:cardiolipin synthase